MADRFSQNRRILKQKQFSSLSVCVILSWVLTAGLLAGHMAGRFGDKLEIEDKINPNTATMESLVRLPGIGPATAAAIIKYRQQDPGRQAFSKPEDIKAVKGIGPKKVQKMQPWLTFSGKQKNINSN